MGRCSDFFSAKIHASFHVIIYFKEKNLPSRVDGPFTLLLYYNVSCRTNMSRYY